MAHLQTNNRPNYILLGQSNWTRWYARFKADARANDLWVIFDGSETILTKPARAPYFDKFESKNAVQEVITDLMQSLDYYFQKSAKEYELDLGEYKDQRERILRAQKMLVDRVDDSLLPNIDGVDGPKDALEKLGLLYEMPPDKAIPLINKQLESLSLVECDSVTAYMSKARQLRADLCTDWNINDSTFLTYIVRGVPTTFEDWVTPYYQRLRDPDVEHDLALKDFETELLAWEWEFNLY